MSDAAIEFGRRIPRTMRFSVAASPFADSLDAANCDHAPLRGSDPIRHESWHGCPRYLTHADGPG
jgi:hypothetical protein